MMEPMTTRVEVWPVAADELGIWLISGDDAWRPDLPVMADNEPHFDVELELASHHAKDSTTLLHSTSWRVRWFVRSAYLHGRDRGRGTCA